MCEKINEREVHLKTLTESLSVCLPRALPLPNKAEKCISPLSQLTATLELHDQVVAIQEVGPPETRISQPFLPDTTYSRSRRTRMLVSSENKRRRISTIKDTLRRASRPISVPLSSLVNASDWAPNRSIVEAGTTFGKVDGWISKKWPLYIVRSIKWERGTITVHGYISHPTPCVET